MKINCREIVCIYMYILYMYFVNAMFSFKSTKNNHCENDHEVKKCKK